MKRITLIFLAVSSSLLALEPSELSLELVDLMKLPERYAEIYRRQFIETERNEKIELPNGFQLTGLRDSIALHFDGYLKENEMKEAIAFYQTPTGAKLAEATYRSGGNFLVLDTKVERWFALRSKFVKEEKERLQPGGPYIKNLKMILSAADQYMLEQNKEQASYSDVVGSYIKEIEPINGESYKDVVVYRKGGKVSVTNADGEVFEFPY